jgi:hypothetical protein
MMQKRALAELGVEVIHAHSPEAKGRVERLFETLQDRLVKEMRLRGISTIKDANEYLDREFLKEFNRRFSVKPKEAESFYQKLPGGIDLDRILCIKEIRSVRNDNTVQHNGGLFQITQPVYVRKVVLEVKTDGVMRLMHKDKALSYRSIAPAKRALTEKTATVRRPRTVHRPPMSHPYKQAMYQARLAMMKTVLQGQKAGSPSPELLTV